MGQVFGCDRSLRLGLNERCSGGTGTGHADAPALATETITGRRDDNGRGMGKRRIHCDFPAAFHRDGRTDEAVEQT